MPSSKACYLICILASFMRAQVVSGWLFYSPVSREQTVEDCKRLQAHNSPFYPSYCNRLLRQAYNVSGSTLQPDLATPFRPSVTKGWGWGPWGEWLEESCPSVCSRRCRRRVRACHGPYQLACIGLGKAEEFDDCPALNNPTTGTGFQRQTSGTTSSDFALYSSSTTRRWDQSSLQQLGHYNETSEVPNDNHLGHHEDNNSMTGSMFPAMPQDRNFRRRRKRLLRT